MESNESIILRIKELISFYGISNGGFADKIGVHRGDMSKYLSGKQRVGEKLKMQILFAYPNINKQWLLSGKGDMFKSSPTADTTLVDYTTASQSNGVPYFNIESAACGALSGFGEALTMGNSNGSVVIPTLPTKEGDVFLQTRGRSMIDARCPERSIPEGAMVLVRRWTQSFIEWGEIYCVATTDGYVIKKLLPGSTDSTVKCVSADSDNYPPYEIPTIDIKALGRVIAIVSTQVL